MRIMALLISIFLWTASTAHALSLSVGGDYCGSCDGSLITLEIIENVGGFDVTLTLDSTDYDESREGIAQIGFGGIKDWTSVSLVSSPTSLMAWADPVESNINSSSLCGGSNGNSGKICTWGFSDIRDDDLYVWEFEVKGGQLQLDTEEWHIGGQYANYSDLTDSSDRTPSGKVLSESGAAAVPEPTAALVFGAGIFFVSRRLRRRA